jgi:hypothetical protein
VHLEEAARKWEVLLEEALEEGVRVRGGAPHGRTPPRGPRVLAAAASSRQSLTSPPRVGKCARGSSPWARIGEPTRQLRWTERTEPIGPTKKQLPSRTRTGPNKEAASSLYSYAAAAAAARSLGPGGGVRPCGAPPRTRTPPPGALPFPRRLFQVHALLLDPQCSLPLRPAHLSLRGQQLSLPVRPASPCASTSRRSSGV